MRIALHFMAAIGVAVGFASSASAQPIQFIFTDTAGNPTSTFNVTPNGTVDIDVYLNDTGAASAFFTNQPAQMNNVNTYHVRGAGFRVVSASPAIARVQSAADVMPNSTNISPQPGQTAPTFNFVTASGANPGLGTATVAESVLGGVGVTANNTGKVFLARLRFTGLSEGNSLLSFEDNDTVFSATSLGTELPAGTNGGTALDPNPGSPIPGLFGSTARIFVAVPEPTSMTLCGLAAVGLGVYRRRKGKVASESVQ